jgi:hypothetical protein
MYDDFMRRTLYLIMSLLCLGIVFSQEQIREFTVNLVPFEDRSDWNELYDYRPPPHVGTMCGNKEFLADDSLADYYYFENLEFLVEDSLKLGLKLFVYSCGNEVQGPTQAGYLDRVDIFLVFEKEYKQVINLFLGLSEKSSTRGKSFERSINIRDFKRLSFGVFSYTEVSDASQEYTEEYCLFSVNREGINFFPCIPTTIHNDEDAVDKSPQLAVIVNWPSSIEVKALTDVMLSEQKEWVGTYTIPNF